MTFKNWLNTKIFDSEIFTPVLNLIKNMKKVKLGGFLGSSKILLLSYLFEKTDKQIIYVCKNEKEAKNLYLELSSFDFINASYFPSIEYTPYQSAVINDNIKSNRLEIINSLINKKIRVVILSLFSLLFNIVPKNKIIPYSINLKKGDKISFDEISKKLIQSGYERVSKVSDFGEFAVRGDILDIHFSLFKNPIRIDFFDDEIESIKSFDIISQNSIEEIENVSLPPHKEFIYGEKEINRANEKIKDISGELEEKEYISEQISNYKYFDGEQYYLNLLYDKTSILDYFDDYLLLLDDFDALIKEEKNIFNEFNEYYNLIALKNKVKILPENLLFKIKDIYNYTDKIIEINSLEDAKFPNDLKYDFTDIPVYLGNINNFKKDVNKYLEENYKIILFSTTNVQKERLEGIFKEFEPFDDMYNIKSSSLSIFPIYLAGGFISRKEKIFFLNDHEVFGKRRKINKLFYSKKTKAIDSFFDLKAGDYVVHINHGVGKFLGIERVKTSDEVKDYIAILYHDNDKVFIPIEQLNLVQKYISGEFDKPKLDKIGSKGWVKTKERVKESIEKLAKELVKLYSIRLKQKGFSFLPDTNWQKEFEAKFPYEETRDQLITIEEVKKDMENSKPMDRLICGDVGFGKTEIAIRASFKAVMSGKQVIILVPTTILAEQHFETFSERLEGYPLNVEMLSRFRSKKEQDEIIKKMSEGNIDIIIGTHRLLSDDIKVKNPGLYIIDEEQRFGVKAKEKIKQFRKTIDCLSLTATPIPRTLHMSLASIRDISIINTPPENRQSVETYVMEFNEEIFIDAVNRELKRDGQIFFLHNRVKTIYVMKKYLEGLIPGIRIVVGHGQMKENSLEDVIHDFIQHKYDLLLATTIIESGIDMPRVNTIFIDHSDKFGLSQLYQLRGRVGRSDKKAYAYLFYRKDKSLTEDAMKRLRVISEYTDLGSGFKIAMKDLEIRGAGNLLGPEQHGDILAVGFQLYCKLLNEAIKELALEETDELVKEKTEVYLELNYTGYIPDNYINDQKQKMEFYKRIAGITYREEIDEIQRSLMDRFGPIPDEIMSLFYISEIRIICKLMNISEIIEKPNNIEIRFTKFSDIDISKLMEIIEENKNRLFIKGNYPNSIFIKIDYDDTLVIKGELIKEILEKIKKDGN